MILEANLDFSVPIINPSGIIRQGGAGIQQKSELQNFPETLSLMVSQISMTHFITITMSPENFEVGFVGAFFCFFFGQTKKKKGLYNLTTKPSNLFVK